MSTLFKYTQEFKQQVVAEILSGKATITEARKLHNIGGNMTIPNWIKHYKNSVNLAERTLQQKEQVMSNLTLDKALARIKELEKEAKTMRNELEENKLESLFYKTMIEVAEERLSIDIKKKIGQQLLKDLK